MWENEDVNNQNTWDNMAHVIFTKHSLTDPLLSFGASVVFVVLFIFQSEQLGFAWFVFVILLDISISVELQFCPGGRFERWGWLEKAGQYIKITRAIRNERSFTLKNIFSLRRGSVDVFALRPKTVWKLFIFLDNTIYSLCPRFHQYK